MTVVVIILILLAGILVIYVLALWVYYLITGKPKERIFSPLEVEESKHRGIWHPMNTIIDEKHYDSKEALFLASRWNESPTFPYQDVLLLLPSGRFARQTHYLDASYHDQAFLLTMTQAAEFYCRAAQRAGTFEMIFGEIIEEA